MNKPKDATGAYSSQHRFLFVSFSIFRALLFAGTCESLVYTNLLSWLPTYFHDQFPNTKVNEEHSSRLVSLEGVSLRLVSLDGISLTLVFLVGVPLRLVPLDVASLRLVSLDRVSLRLISFKFYKP